MISDSEAKLCELLEAAAVRFDALGDLIGSHYDSGAELAHYLRGRIQEIEAGKLSLVNKQELFGIFAPTSDWDDTVGDVALGNEIYALIKQSYLLDILQAFQRY